MNKFANVTVRAALALIIVTMALIAIVGLMSGHTFLAGTAILLDVAMLCIAFTRRGFLASALIVAAGFGPLLFVHGHPWLAGITAYVGLTMLFLAWNHAVHSLNRASDERQAGWEHATEER